MLPTLCLVSFLFLSINGQDLSKTHFKIAVLHSPPFVLVEENNTYVGFLIDMLEEIQNRLNFTYELYIVPDGKFGTLDDESGEWNGIMGEIVSGNADIALAPLTITAKRARDVVFSAPYMDAGIVPLYLKPAPGERLAFQNVIDLVTKTDLKYGAIAGGATYSFFKDNSYKLYEAMGEYMTTNYNDVMARTAAEAAAKVREGGYVFLGEESMLSWMVGDEPCNLMTVGKTINVRHNALAFPKGSEDIGAAFSREILLMKENGLFKIFQDTWWEDDCREPKFCICEENNSDERTEVDTSDVEDD